jgi:hypothetical protein
MARLTTKERERSRNAPGKYPGDRGWQEEDHRVG